MVSKTPVVSNEFSMHGSLWRRCGSLLGGWGRRDARSTEWSGAPRINTFVTFPAEGDAVA
jgi:hypothetical protein